MPATVAGIHLGIDTHANRPAGNAVPDGSVYSCSTHSLVYKSNFAGNSWATWATLGGVGGSVATDAIWDAAGDLAVGTGADTAAKLTKGAAGTVPTAGASTLAYAFPPGYEFDYAQITSPVNIVGTSEAAATTIVTGNAVTYDGSTIVMVECFFEYFQQPGADTNSALYLYDGASSIGRIALQTGPNATGYSGSLRFPGVGGRRRITPSAGAHTYSIRGMVPAGTGVVSAGAGGNGNGAPGFIRITKV